MKRRAIKLVFCSRPISSCREVFSSSYTSSKSSCGRHLHQCANKGVAFPIRPQHTETIRFISPYTTAADDRGGGRQGQISGGNLTDRSPKLWAQLLGLGAIVTIVGGYFWYHSSERKGPIQARKSQSSRTVLTDQKTSIGGPFKLIDSKGQVVTSQDLMGQWTLIYFGYTSCPDDCPEEVQKLAEAIVIIEQQTGQRVVPVFITLDPKRDSPAQLQAYLSEFHPRFLGLMGTADDIRQVAREYRVFYRKIEEEGSDYLVEHSNLIYLMDPKMEFVKFFGKEYDVNRLARGIMEEMKEQNQSTG